MPEMRAMSGVHTQKSKHKVEGSQKDSKDQKPLKALVQVHPNMAQKDDPMTEISESAADMTESNENFHNAIGSLLFVSDNLRVEEGETQKIDGKDHIIQNSCHVEEIQWQHAVYTRSGPREYYTFSHIGTTSVSKSFPASLSIPCRCHVRDVYKRNLESLRSATVLVLVTGNWAIHISLETFLNNNYSIDRLPMQSYDHLCRMGSLDQGECAEVSKEYRTLKYQCTMASYEAGRGHAWNIHSVIPMLSDIVILPRLLEEKRLKPVIFSFCRAMRKSMKDSVIVAGNQRIREEHL